jgi:2-polyprenyl-3-methyl-5-hydroxy-6-metoxy-1,4-benzoquinol methylase
MYSFLVEQNTRPTPFSAYTAEELWTDPHVAQQMLAYHLDPEQDVASRNHRFIERSVGWLNRTFHLAQGKRVLDLGCGPGLYANGLATSGAEVTGVDFSQHSLAHARATAERGKLEVEFVEGNYLDLEVRGLYDLVLLIYGDICALSPS